MATSAAALERHRAAWEDLAGRAVDDNFYGSPAALVPAFRHFSRRQRAFVLFVYDDRPDGTEQLIGCAPFSLLPATPATLAPILSTYVGPHAYLSHPLLDRDRAGAAISAIWSWIERPGRPWRLTRLAQLGQDSTTWTLVRSELARRRRPHWIRNGFDRAVLRRLESFDAFLAALSPRRRKNLRRARRRLEALGPLSVDVHRSLERSPDLARRFMELEARGWKGDNRSALVQTAADRAYFTELTTSAATLRRLFFIEVSVGGRPIAIAANFLQGRTMYAFKIAYDPEFARYSPGVLAEIETVRAFHAEPDLERADGGTTGGSYLDALWRRTERMHDIYVSNGSRTSLLHLGALVGASRAKRAVSRAIARLAAIAPRR